MTGRLAHERIEVEDTAVATLRFKNGALGVIEAATSAYPGLLKRTEIHGDRGSARVEQDDITLWDFADEALGRRGAGLAQGGPQRRRRRPQGHQPRRTPRAARRLPPRHRLGRQPRVDGRDGRKAVEIIRAIYHSAKTGQPVKLPFDDCRLPHRTERPTLPGRGRRRSAPFPSGQRSDP